MNPDQAARLRSAALAVLRAWDAEDEYEREDLSADLWAAVARLRHVVLGADEGESE